MIWVNAPAIALRAGGTIAANRFCVAGASAGAVLQASTAGTVPYLGCLPLRRGLGRARGHLHLDHRRGGGRGQCRDLRVRQGDVHRDGKAVTVSAATEMVCGLAMDASTADTQLIGVMLQAPNLFT
jgi:hypothetical protein